MRLYLFPEARHQPDWRLELFFCCKINHFLFIASGFIYLFPEVVATGNLSGDKRRIPVDPSVAERTISPP